jgi:hypothetical protein
VYVYNSLDMSLIGEFSTVKCSKYFSMGKETLTKYIKNGIPFKGKIFSSKNCIKVFNMPPQYRQRRYYEKLGELQERPILG